MGFSSFNRKERLQISKKLKTKGRPSKKSVNWRFIRNERKKQKEQEVIEELESRQQQHINGRQCDERSQPFEKIVLSREPQIGNQKTWYSLSVALPGSILNNVQTRELKTYITGELARTCAIFCVDEVVIFDETSKMTQEQIDAYYAGSWTGKQVINDTNSECNFHMAKIFEYLECPQYLRKSIFSMHASLQYAGLLNPLDAMHHLRSTDSHLPYREGIILERPSKNGQRCDVGLERELILKASEQLPSQSRVTVKIASNKDGSKKLKGIVTSSSQIREEAGVYWGYSVRLARSLSEVMAINTGYDVVIGTSERGTSLSEIPIERKENCKILILFGGLKGLEAALQSDQSIEEKDPAAYFRNYVNCLPDQGSRVIRTEEAIPICLTALKCKLDLISVEIL